MAASTKVKENNIRRALAERHLSLVKLRLHGSEDKSYIVVDARCVVVGCKQKIYLNDVEQWLNTNRVLRD